MAIADQGEAALRLIDHRRPEFHALKEAVRAGGLDTQRFETTDHVFLSFALALAAGIAPLVLVGRDLLHRVPPGFSIEMLRRLSGASGHDEQQCR